MNLKLTILIIIAFLNFILGLVVLLQGKRNVVSGWFTVFSFSLAPWTACMIMYIKDPVDWNSIYFWSLILHFAGSMVAQSFLFFSIYYLEDKKKIKLYYQLLLLLPLFFIFYFLFLDKKIIVGLNIFPDNRQLIYGLMYPVYFFHFFSYMFFGVVNLFLKSLKFKGDKKKEVLVIAIGVLIPLVFAGIINMVFAFFGNFYYAWTGPIFLLIVFGFISYATIKLQFLNIKVITTEIFSAFLVIITFVQIFQTSVLHVGFRVSIFLITLIFAILLIRSVLNEVRRREELEILNNKLKHTTTKLEKANKELQRLDDAKSEFLSIASHQLRTPTTIIKGYVSMMQEGSFGKISKSIKENLDKVYLATERLLNLIENLLDISRIEAGRLEFNLEAVDLTLIAKSLVEDFKQKAGEKKLKIDVFYPSKLPTVLADLIKIKEVASNLIDNAIKYTKEGSIGINLHQECSSVVFSVSDTGMGMSAEDISRLFNKFVRGENMTITNPEGTGLGLYFARVVIENMGGRIWAESAGKGQGSKFCFSLPLADKKKAKKIKI